MVYNTNKGAFKSPMFLLIWKSGESKYCNYEIGTEHLD